MIYDNNVRLNCSVPYHHSYCDISKGMGTLLEICDTHSARNCNYDRTTFIDQASELRISQKISITSPLSSLFPMPTMYNILYEKICVFC
jgi:hypothetical protein